MTTREQIMTVLEGGVPDKTPYIMYDGMMDGKWNGLPQGAALEPWLSLLWFIGSNFRFCVFVQ
jgi:hypothetical protein